MVHRQQARGNFCGDLGPIHTVRLCSPSPTPQRPPREQEKELMDNTLMFVIGSVIFVAYISGYLMMVHRQNQLQIEEEKNQSLVVGKTDEVDVDGIGNYGRFPKEKVAKKKTKKEPK
jgi:hypothetical protein